MEKEEKEAIDDCKNFMNVGDYIGEKEYKELQIAINYIDKLQKEKKELIEANDKLKSTKRVKAYKVYEENKQLKEKIKEYEIGIVKE